jgi:hypothetical protein
MNLFANSKNFLSLTLEDGKTYSQHFAKMINVFDETHPVQAKYKSWLKFLINTDKIQFLKRLEDFPQVLAKYNGFDNATKIKFLEDFAEADAAVLKALDEEADLFNVWKEVYKSSKIDVLKAAKTLKSKGLIFNTVFEVINNPGCIGHLDADVEKLLLADGWTEVFGVTTLTSSFQKINWTKQPNRFSFLLWIRLEPQWRRARSNTK